MPFITFITWIALAVFVGIFAGRHGRSTGKWVALAVVLSPVMMWLLLLALGPVPPNPTTHQQCTACKEWAHPEATLCRHCGSVLPHHAARTAQSQPGASASRITASGISTGEFTG